ncbi:MAG: DNA glycosylase AlkZ-like family protein, partial [Ilumatobacteraceae bacterium]
MTVHELTQDEARRIAVRAQLLDAHRPTDLLEVVRHLTVLQYDQTAAVAPNADLVLWSRLGPTYRPAQLLDALERRELVELRGFIRLAEDLALYRADMAAWGKGTDLKPYQLGQRDWVAANDGCRRDIIRRLRASGPMTSRELPDTCVKPWQSSGWNNNRNVVMMLGFMEQRGEVAAVGREGRDRLWDLAERVFPKGAAAPAAAARRQRDERRLRAMGLMRAKTTETPVEPNDVGMVGDSAVIAGVPGEWRVDPEQIGRPFEGRAALLSPLDRLVFDRARMVDLFAFDYALEMYKPVEQRKWGY